MLCVRLLFTCRVDCQYVPTAFNGMENNLVVNEINLMYWMTNSICSIHSIHSISMSYNISLNYVNFLSKRTRQVWNRTDCMRHLTHFMNNNTFDQKRSICEGFVRWIKYTISSIPRTNSTWISRDCIHQLIYCP